MTRRHLFWRVFASYVALALPCLLVFAVLADGLLRELLNADIAAVRWALFLSLVVVSILAVGASALLARRVVKPLESIRRGAERFGQGDFSRRLLAPELPELRQLATTLNRMAEQLDARIKEITRQRNEQGAILESLQEGVIALDQNERVISVNAAAARLLRIDPQAAAGRLIQEAIRHAELQRLVRRALAGATPTEDEEILVDTGDGAPTRLQAGWAPLRDHGGRPVGTLLILANVTRLHQLENLRREFVANVSHELRTPITSIRGFAETLLDGALEDPADARRFVEIIARQSERLEGLIVDLLTLSGLESRPQVELQRTAVAPLLRAVQESHAARAGELGVALALEVEEGLSIRANARLLEQALGNLVDNALKYAGTHGSTVTLAGRREGDKVLLQVRDQGAGIPPEHLPRLFERFFRVDKARSREAGGTGLGLSIVKHVAQAHGGTVAVESRPGVGTAFKLTLPEDRKG